MIEWKIYKTALSIKKISLALLYFLLNKNFLFNNIVDEYLTRLHLNCVFATHNNSLHTLWT